MEQLPDCRAWPIDGVNVTTRVFHGYIQSALRRLPIGYCPQRTEAISIEIAVLAAKGSNLPAISF